MKEKQMQANRVFLTTSGPADWQYLLPTSAHWRTGYSAKSLAHCWEQANGFPPEVIAAFERSGINALIEARLIAAFPEQKVVVPGGGSMPQNDILALAFSGTETMAITVEGKVAEPFDKLIGEWKTPPTPGKEKRLAFFCDLLGLDCTQLDSIRYQLVQRTACAVATAQRWGAKHALMLVHSFHQGDLWFEDFVAFASLFGIDAEVDHVGRACRRQNATELYLGWVKGAEDFLKA